MQKLTDHIRQINLLCDAHHVKSLFAFGSVVSNNLKADSDIDLIVDIDSDDPIDYSERITSL